MKMKKNKYMLALGIGLILAVTILLIFLPFGKKKDGREPETPDTPDTTLSANDHEETTVTEAAGGTETTERSLVSEATAVSEGTDRSTEEMSSETDRSAEEDTSGVTETSTEELTEEAVSGAGYHQGKLGSSYMIPDGFYDISPKDQEEGYYYIYENPERNIRIQVAESHLEGRRIGFDGEYTVLHYLYLRDDSSYVSYDTKEEDHYVISGFTEHRKKVFYIEGFKYPDRNEVQISVEYPNDGWKDSCDELLNEVLQSYEYHVMPDPDRKQTEQDPETDMFGETGQE